MGEVYRARDTKLNREAAIKLLPELFANDPERLARLTREARMLAALNHRNIAAIHGLHEDAGRLFLAMELVPGEDLAERLARGPIPVGEAADLALKIAAALEYAHERGIVHRDLKPANVKVTPDADVKVLDFGLAKAFSADPATSGPTTTPAVLPTITSLGTVAGMILGTAAYMSPEQARGRPVDRRADIWSFGCVLFEMLTGQRAFDGETVTDVLAAVVTRDPDWNALPAATPASMRRLLVRCLDKDPRTRLRDIGEARIILANPGSAAPGPVSPSVAPPRRNGMLWAGAAVLALVAGIGVGRWLLAPQPQPQPAFEFDVTVPGARIETGSFTLSPDGSRLALIVRDANGDRQLCVRSMDSVEARVLTGTTGAIYPFWSPDGREIAYFANNQLFRIALDDAVARLVSPVTTPAGGT